MELTTGWRQCLRMHFLADRKIGMTNRAKMRNIRKYIENDNQMSNVCVIKANIESGRQRVLHKSNKTKIHVISTNYERKEKVKK